MKDFKKEELEEIVKKCESKADLCRAVGLKPVGGNYKTIDKIIKNFQLNTNHFNKEVWNKGKHYICKLYKLEDVLVENSPINNTYSLKHRLFYHGLKERKCEICGYTENLEMHHINGNPTDNRLENLQILCPNCHAKTNNFRAKNIKCKTRTHKDPKEIIITEELANLRKIAKRLTKKNNINLQEAYRIVLENSYQEYFKKRKTETKNKIVCPVCKKEFYPRLKTQKYCSSKCLHIAQHKAEITKEELIQTLINLKGNYSQVAKKYNVTDNAIRKWCIKYGMPYHRKLLVEYLNNIDDPTYIRPEEIKLKRTYNFNLICEIYKEGYNQKDIAAYIGCCQDVVRKALLLNNIPLRDKVILKIGKYSLDGKLLLVYYSAKDAMCELIEQNKAKTSKGSHHIMKCCRKEIPTAYGYKWKYISRKPITEFKKE